MNKTVNINLAGIFFHIDEDAYTRLQHYLDAIKRSLHDTQGQEEIIADIEARIAELFSEKIKNEHQVISTKEVDEVISIMGQPEDYMVDEEIFEDEPSYSHTSAGTTKGKQLFRDTDNSYIGGVSSGLGHYLGIEALWIRLLWVLLTVASSGAFILIYIALWLFVPEAKTTADKLSMRGEEVNISNIEKKIREGFDDVAGKVKNADYAKYGRKAKSGASSAATGVSAAILFILNIFVKFIGIIIILVAGSVLISLFIGLFTVGTFGLFDAPWSDYIEMAAIGAPLWVISLLTFIAVGIPFFFLFILGLKILVKKLKSIGTTAKLVLLGLWLLAVIGLAILGIQQATQRAFDGEVVATETLPVKSNDTLYVAMQSNPLYSSHMWRRDVQIKYDEQNRKIMYITHLDFMVKPTTDSIASVEVTKTSDGRNYKDAKDRAQHIKYSTKLEGNKLYLDSFLTSPLEDNFRNQEVKVTLYLPEGSVLYADQNVADFNRYSNFEGGVLKNGQLENFVTITKDGTKCPTCPEIQMEDGSWNNDSSWDEDENGIHIENSDSTEKVDIHINKNGVQVDKNNENKVRIDKHGIQIKNN